MNNAGENVIDKQSKDKTEHNRGKHDQHSLSVLFIKDKRNEINDGTNEIKYSHLHSPSNGERPTTLEDVYVLLIPRFITVELSGGAEPWLIYCLSNLVH